MDRMAPRLVGATRRGAALATGAPPRTERDRLESAVRDLTLLPQGGTNTLRLTVRRGVIEGLRRACARRLRGDCGFALLIALVAMFAPFGCSALEQEPTPLIGISTDNADVLRPHTTVISATDGSLLVRVDGRQLDDMFNHVTWRGRGRGMEVYFSLRNDVDRLHAMKQIAMFLCGTADGPTTRLPDWPLGEFLSNHDGRLWVRALDIWALVYGLVEMTRTDHRGPGAYTQNHPNTGQSPSQINREVADKERRQHWNEQWDDGRWGTSGGR